MTILTVTQPYAVTWITLLNPYMMFKNPNKLAIVHAQNEWSSMQCRELHSTLLYNIWLVHLAGWLAGTSNWYNIWLFCHHLPQLAPAKLWLIYCSPVKSKVLLR